MKIRSGGLKAFEQRVLDGDVRAMRALVRQATGPNTLDVAFRGVEVREAPAGAGSARLLFTGYASVFDEPYTMRDWLGEYQEIMRQGAVTKTLSESPDTIFCPNHDWLAVPMARTKPGTCRLSQDSTGLFVEADLDGSRDDVYRLRSAIEAGEMDAMSFAFYVVRQLWSPDYEQRDITEVDLNGGDVSVVTWPANPATTGTTALRQRAARSIARSRVPALIVERARRERRAGAALSAATLDTLQAVLDLIADADNAVDAAQPLLAELMGVPNPDEETAEQAEDDQSEAAEGETLSGGGGDPAAVRARLALLARA